MVEKGIIRPSELTELLGLSRTTIWRRVRSGQLPPPVRLGGPGSRAVGWKRTEIEKWIQGLHSA